MAHLKKNLTGFAFLNNSRSVTNLWHLWMREVLVDDDALDQHGVLHPTTDLALDLDELEVDVLALDVGHRQHGVDGNLGHHAMTLVDDF